MHQVLIGYLEQTQNEFIAVFKLSKYEIEEYMVLDISTRRNLELTETMREKAEKALFFGFWTEL